jgi:hypothetical protein
VKPERLYSQIKNAVLNAAAFHGCRPATFGRATLYRSSPMLTEEESAEFNLFNLLAFDLHRIRAREKNVIPTMWLVTSPEVREQMRQDVVSYYSVQHMLDCGVPGPDREGFLERIEPLLPKFQASLDTWREMETEYKRLRDEEHNARAFFCEE